VCKGSHRACPYYLDKGLTALIPLKTMDSTAQREDYALAAGLFGVLYRSLYHAYCVTDMGTESSPSLNLT